MTQALTTKLISLFNDATGLNDDTSPLTLAIVAEVESGCDGDLSEDTIWNVLETLVSDIFAFRDRLTENVTGLQALAQED